jgi:ABC-type glutathione transport system ATPase component
MKNKHDSIRKGEGPILKIEGLTVDFLSNDEPVRAVDNVSFHVNRGETLVILGESGSGKSVSTSTVMDLVDCPPRGGPPKHQRSPDRDDLSGSSRLSQSGLHRWTADRGGVREP